jgi:hypothetical protein
MEDGMDATAVRLVAAGIIGAHGIGHVLGVLPAIGIPMAGTSSGAGPLASMTGVDAARLVAGIAFAVPTVGFVLAAAALATDQAWWRPVAAASAVVSMAAIGVFPQALPTSSTVGAVVVNLVVLYGALIARWGSEATPG